MPKPEQYIVGIDIGSSKVGVLIGQRGDKGAIEVVGKGQAPNRGTRRGQAGGLRAQVGQGTATLNLSLAGDQRYTIDQVTFDDPKGQLSWRGNAPRNGVLTDSNTDEEEGYYHVQVRDSVANCTIPCDPMVVNERVGK